MFLLRILLYCGGALTAESPKSCGFRRLPWRLGNRIRANSNSSLRSYDQPGRVSDATSLRFPLSGILQFSFTVRFHCSPIRVSLECLRVDSRKLPLYLDSYKFEVYFCNSRNLCLYLSTLQSFSRGWRWVFDLESLLQAHAQTVRNGGLSFWMMPAQAPTRKRHGSTGSNLRNPMSTPNPPTAPNPER